MLRHTGQKRSFNRNVRLAILLCLNAGFINGAGFLAFSVLTTNVIILTAVTISGHTYNGSLHQTEYFAGSLLFAMGMQNALVSVISGSVVRTTNLTGMFTDLGTDLSIAVIQQWKLTVRIQRRILLRIVIITSFLFGGVMGTFLFLQYHLNEHR